jgi:signal transduction histidine kinase
MTRTTEEVTDFWSTVVFELRQPMTAVRGQAQRAQLLLKTDPERANDALGEVVAQIVRLDRLLDELRERVCGKPMPTPPTP